MSDAAIPSLRRVIARFLALLGSIRDTLLGVLWASFILRVPRSTGVDWDLVLNCSSKAAMLSSYERFKEVTERKMQRQN